MTNMDGIKPNKLFVGSCTALIATAMTFAVFSAIMNPLKQQFLLTNEQVGYIGGAALWGFPISILILGPLCSVLGMRLLLGLAFCCFTLGVGMTILANGFWMLFLGALTIAFANGLVEGVCNPLVATIFPDRKVEKLNKFHAWFPGGIVIGGLLCFFLDKAGNLSWQLRVGSIMIPAIAFAIILLGEKFPETERAQAGVSFGSMIKATLCRPFFILLFVCMMITASLELGPNRWVSAIFDSAGFSGILILVWTSVLMSLMRQSAGKIVHRVAPTGILLGSALLAGIGLWMLSYAETKVAIFLADTIFAIGVCYFWPTMLGVTSERVPKGGELALALMGFAGNIAVGLLTIPQMGNVADTYGNEKFALEPTTALIRQAVTVLPAAKDKLKDPTLKGSMEQTLADGQKVLDVAAKENKLMPKTTANVLRGIQLVVPNMDLQEATRTQMVADAKKLLDPADVYGGRMAFRYVSSLAIIIVLVFGAVYAADKARGGYKAEHVSA